MLTALIVGLAGCPLKNSSNADTDNESTDAIKLQADDKLRLWNHLGNEAQVLNGEVGPGLEFYDPTLHGTSDCCDLVGNTAYVESPFDGAVTLSDGPYWTPGRIHNVVLNNASEVINGKSGAISLWYWQAGNPVGYSHGVYRIFDGAYGILRSPRYFPNAAGPRLFMGGALNDTASRLYFDFINPATGVLTQVRSPDDGEDGYLVPNADNRWINILAVWDQNGVDETSETMQLYVDGAKAAVSTESNWQNEIGKAADIGGGNDANIAFKFAVGELKIWGFANTRDSYPASMDIAPNDPDNHIDVDSVEPVAVELLGTPVFDVHSVVRQSVKLGISEARPLRRSWRAQDFNKDGFDDLLLQFRVSDLNLSCAQESIELTGMLKQGLAFFGTDRVLPLGCNP